MLYLLTGPISSSSSSSSSCSTGSISIVVDAVLTAYTVAERGSRTRPTVNASAA